jgi:hypothetical protein
MSPITAYDRPSARERSGQVTMSDKIIPFRRRGEAAPAAPKPEASPVQASPTEQDDDWTLVTIVAKAPPTSR